MNEWLLQESGYSGGFRMKQVSDDCWGALNSTLIQFASSRVKSEVSSSPGARKNPSPISNRINIQSLQSTGFNKNNANLIKRKAANYRTEVFERWSSVSIYLNRKTICGACLWEGFNYKTWSSTRIIIEII
jgi:hypothetical protein